MDDSTVVLGVTGSIAVYKALDVASKLVQSGLSVRTIMTENATRFVAPLSFESITHHRVLTSLWEEQSDMDISHIRLAHGAAVVAVVPATANVIAKCALGIADDALTATLLASSAPLLLAPAMNTSMWTNAATRQNVSLLRERGAHVVGPEAVISRKERPAKGAWRRHRKSCPLFSLSRGAGRIWRGGTSWSRPARRKKRSIRYASCPIAAPARWATRSRRPQCSAEQTSRLSADRLR